MLTSVSYSKSGGSRPVVVVSLDDLFSARTDFGDAAQVVAGLPAADDVRGWADLLGRAVYIDEKVADAMLPRAAAQGVDLLARINVADCDIEDPHLTLKAARREAVRHLGGADLSILEYPRPNPERLPLAAFGKRLGGAIASAAASATVHPDMAAAAALAVLSGVTGGLVEARPSDGHREPAIIFSLIIGSPGSNKTGALKIFERPLGAVERDVMAAHAAVLVEYNDMPKDERPADPPTRPLVRLSDFTPEAASYALAHQPRGILGIVPEMSSILAQLGLSPTGTGYSSAGSLSAFLLGAFDGGKRDYARRSVGAEPLVIETLAMPLLVAAQPDIAASLIANPLRDGLADRFMTVWPDLRLGDTRNSDTPTMTSDEAAEEIASCLRELYHATTRLAQPDFISGERKIAVPFDADAVEMFRGWSARAIALAKHLDDTAAGARIKATTMWARSAALFAFVRHVLEGAPLIVDLDIAELVDDWMSAAMSHRAKAERFSAEPLSERRARALAQAAVMRGAKTASPVEIRRDWRLPLLRTTGDLMDALCELSDLGWLRTPIVRRGRRDDLPAFVDFNPDAIRAGRGRL